jgi:hypothetical protein
MSIGAGDLAFYGSQSMPDSDTPTEIGGAIKLTTKMEFTDITPAGAVEMVSDAAGDTTQNITVVGRNAAGELITDTQTVNGTTAVDFVGTFERILKVTKSAATTGTLTIRKDAAGGDLVLMAPTITEVRRIHYAAVADVAGGSERKYYEKIFCKNEHATLSLLTAMIKENSDPSGLLAFALETTKDGTGTNGVGNNRLVAPSSGVSAFNGSDKAVPDTDLAADEAIGIWTELTLAAGTAAAKSSYGLRATGNTT